MKIFRKAHEKLKFDTVQDVHTYLKKLYPDNLAYVSIEVQDDKTYYQLGIFNKNTEISNDGISTRGWEQAIKNLQKSKKEDDDWAKMVVNNHFGLEEK